MPRKHRTILLVLAALAVIAAIVVIPSLSDDDELGEDVPTAGQTATTTTPDAPSRGGEHPVPATPVITVRDGKPVGGVQRLSYKHGDTVRFTVQSDVADEIHVHGYNLKQDVPANGHVTFTFQAKADGIYEIELERRATQIAELRVRT
jgi:heme/copper-type cytochrome/quinol oxidase subunit 2